jgi:hypothetical protein
MSTNYIINMLKLDYFSSQYAYLNNTSNHSNYSPFLFTDENTIIDIEYYNCLPEKLQIVLHCEITNIIINEKFIYPHEDQLEHPQYFILYEIFNGQYREEYWYDPKLDSWPNSKFLIKLNKKDVESLLQQKVPQNLLTKIDNLIKNSFINEELFFKFSCGSVKHDQQLIPVKSGLEIINEILSSKRLLYDLEKASRYAWIQNYVVLSKWIEIDECCLEEKGKYEYRIFVKDKQVRAISQQNWNKRYIYIEERENIFQKITDLIDRTHVKRGVCDVWYDKKNDKCWLIEINPFGPGLSSGSASFHWIRDKNVLWKEQTTECVWRVMI